MKIFGNAFDNHPRRSGNYNKSGEWYIRTYEGNEDAPTGTIYSTEFVLSSNTLRAKLAGGYHWNNPVTFCGISLERKVSATEWEPVRQSTGYSSNDMREIHWGLYDLIGKTVRLKICDLSSGQWGQVVADDIRILNEEPARDFSTEFPGSKLPDQLNYHWVDSNPAPTVDNGSLVLSLNATTTQVDPIMFGIRKDGLKIEGPSVGHYFTDTSYTGETNIYLRIHGANDTFSFFSSFNGVDWVAHATVDTRAEGKNLIKAGLYLKTWGSNNVTAKFASFSYLASPNQDGTIILVK